MSDDPSYLASLHTHSTPDAIIHDVIRQATGASMTSKHRIIAGEMSEVYEISLPRADSVILRISHSDDPAHPQYEQERWALDACRAVGGIPAPEMLLITHLPQADGTLLSLNVQNKIPGRPLDELLPRLPTERVRAITEQAGVILARIHTVRAAGFGPLHAGGTSHYPAFLDFFDIFAPRLDEFLAMARATGFDPRKMERIFALIAERGPAFAAIPATLNHEDFLPRHILIDDRDTITGIIDWGDIQGHHPLNDLAKWDYYVPEIPLSYLITGYAHGDVLDEDFMPTLRLLKLYRGLGVLDWYYHAGYRPRVEKAKEELAKDLAALEG